MDRATRAVRESGDAFVLHAYPYKETSLIVEFFTRTHGRVAAVAKGAKRPGSRLRGLMMAFQPLAIAWSGRSELRTLHVAEWQGGIPQLGGPAILCGFYLNELVLKLLPRDDPHERLFEAYAEAVLALGNGSEPEPVLRQFERAFLQEIGYGLVLDRDPASGLPIAPERRYRYEPGRGPVEVPAGVREGPENGLELSGSTLLDIAAGAFRNPVTLAQSKALMRALINHQLGEQRLATRRLFRDLQQTGES